MTTTVVHDVAEWQRLTSHAFVPLRCSTPGPDFSGSLDVVTSAERVTVCEVSTSAVVVRRQAHDLDGSSVQTVLLVVQLEESSTVAQGRHTQVLSPGRAIILDTRRPYEIVADAPLHRQLVIRIERTALRVSPALLARLSGHASAEASPLVASLTGVASSLRHGGRLTRDADAYAAEAMLDLTRAVVHEEAGRTGVTASGGRRAAFERCVDLVHAELSNPDFDVAALARRSHLSVRSLHLLFAEFGQRPGSFAREVRLTRAKDLLLSASGSDNVMADVARRCGFADASTFARAFRRTYGLSPTAMRASHEPGAGGA